MNSCNLHRINKFIVVLACESKMSYILDYLHISLGLFFISFLHDELFLKCLIEYTNKKECIRIVNISRNKALKGSLVQLRFTCPYLKHIQSEFFFDFFLFFVFLETFIRNVF